MIKSIKVAREGIESAQSVVVLCGAGISAESGIPTFRGKEGLWKNHRAEDLATPEAFDRNPELVWAWYQWRRTLISTKKPNAAHLALVSLEKSAPAFTLITQNVDGLHALAGSRKMIELHGNIWKTRCTGCGEVTENRSQNLPPLPKCRQCKSLLRPDIVWFGEAIDPANLSQSIEACQRCDVILVIGTSAVVQPAASFASLAQNNGAMVVEINPVPSLPDKVDVCMAGPAAEIVPKLSIP
ncbi:MAG: NAD-dependent deacetylase [Nitrospiria bacterium]